MSRAWVATAAIFSGRPDPAWPVSEAIAQELEDMWKDLSPVSEQPRASTVLGYRGCSLTDQEGRTWHAHSGMVTVTAGNSSESRRDPERTFERKLLESAPTGLLPPSFIEDVWERR